MALSREGNGYRVNASLPFAAPKKTNSKALDTFNKKNTTKVEEPNQKETKKPIEKPDIKKEPKTNELIDEPTNVKEDSNVNISNIEIDEPEKADQTVKEQKQTIPTITPVLKAKEELTDNIDKVESKLEIAEREVKPQQDNKNYKESSSKLSKFTGTRKNTTFAFCDTNDISYIKIKANQLGLTYQDYLAEVLLETIDIVNDNNFDFTEKTYQSTKTGLKNPVNDRFALREDFLLELKKAAASVGMKRSAFVAMCVHKARKADPNPAWDL